MQRIDFFGPTPAVGTQLLVRGHNEQESARHFRHGLEVFDADGRLWLRMTGAGYWRFYLPFGHVNFFGPKDQYFLSATGRRAVAAFPALPLPRTAGRPEATGAARRGARVTMTPRELADLPLLEWHDAELNDWFFSRMLAKDAVRAAWNEKHGEAMFPADMETEADRWPASSAGRAANRKPSRSRRSRSRLPAARSRRSPRSPNEFGIALVGLQEATEVGCTHACRAAARSPMRCGFAAEDWPVDARLARCGAVLVEQRVGSWPGSDGPAEGCVVATTFCGKEPHDLRTASELYRDLARGHGQCVSGPRSSDAVGPDTRIFADLGLASIELVVLGERLEQHLRPPPAVRHLPQQVCERAARTTWNSANWSAFLQQHV